VIQVMLWLPLAAGLLCFVVPLRAVSVSAILGSVVVLGLAIALVAGFDTAEAGLQHAVSESWIPDLGVRYELGVDGISLFLILLTALMWAGATAFSIFRMPERARIYFFMLGLAETAALGAFLAQPADCFRPQAHHFGLDSRNDFPGLGCQTHHFAAPVIRQGTSADPAALFKLLDQAGQSWGFNAKKARQVSLADSVLHPRHVQQRAPFRLRQSKRLQTLTKLVVPGAADVADRSAETILYGCR